MEFIKQYPYIAIALVLGVLFLALRSRNDSGSFTKIDGGSENALALAQLASEERESDENRKFGLVNTLLNYDVSKRTLESQDSLARLALKEQTNLANLNAQNQIQLAALQGSFQQYATQMQYELQRYQLQRAYNAQRRNDWLGLITTGISSVAPFLLGNFAGFGSATGSNTPRFGTPPFNPYY